MSTGEIDLDDEAEIVLPDALSEIQGSDELSQIRNLLYGEYAQRTLDRVDSLEREVVSLLSDLRSDMDARIDEIDARISNEVDVRTRMATNLVARVDEEAQVRRDAHAGLRDDLDRTSGEIHDKIGGVRAELVDRIESTNADLRERDIDLRRRSDAFRGSLAGLLEEAASSLEAMQD